MTTELKPCPFCGGEADLDLNGTQPEIICSECGISYSIQASDHFTYEERHNDSGFSFIMEPHYCYAEKGLQRAREVLTEYWNTRTPEASKADAVEVVTPTDISEHIKNWRFNDDYECDFGSYLALKYPNGLKIIKD